MDDRTPSKRFLKKMAAKMAVPPPDNPQSIKIRDCIERVSRANDELMEITAEWSKLFGYRFDAMQSKISTLNMMESGQFTDGGLQETIFLHRILDSINKEKKLYHVLLSEKYGINEARRRLVVFRQGLEEAGLYHFTMKNQLIYMDDTLDFISLNLKKVESIVADEERYLHQAFEKTDKRALNKFVRALEKDFKLQKELNNRTLLRDVSKIHVWATDLIQLATDEDNPQTPVKAILALICGFGSGLTAQILYHGSLTRLHITLIGLSAAMLVYLGDAIKAGLSIDKSVLWEQEAILYKTKDVFFHGYQ